MSEPLQTTGKLDTSGVVSGPFNVTGYLCWDDLSPFTQGYVEALFASDLDNDGDSEVPAGLTLVGLRKGFSDLAPETLARIIADCEAFRASPAHDHGGDRKAKGAALWKARNAVPNLGSSRYRFPPLTVRLGDGGKVRFAKATGETV